MRRLYTWFVRVLSKLHPASLLLYSYLSTILVGTGLLMLPAATVSGHIGLLDALFTSTSAVCVTGLIVVDTGSYFTVFGQLVILVMIQLGGLGIMTVSVAFFSVIGKKVLFRHRMAMQEIFSHTPREDIQDLVLAILVFTAIAEIIGAVILTAIFWARMPFGQAAYSAVFHSVSAFCNAGFSLYQDSFMAFRGSGPLNFTICFLIILGGLGFPVVYEIYQKKFTPLSRKVRYSVHTKTVLITTGILIFLGMGVFLYTDMRHLGSGDIGEILLASFFQSVTCRTAGFNTVDIGSLNSTALSFMMFLMVVGASPGSCGGGVKTTTLALLSKLSWSRIRGQNHVNMFHKTLPDNTVTQSISVVFLFLIIILVASFLLLAAQQGRIEGSDHGEFLEYLFETISAFGTVGLSTGATDTLTSLGKVYIILLMLIGRLGVTAFAYILTGIRSTSGVEYAEENIMIG